MYKKDTKYNGFIHKLLIDKEQRKQLYFDVCEKAKQAKKQHQQQAYKLRNYKKPKVLGKKILDRQDQNSKCPYSIIGYDLLSKNPVFFIVDKKDNKNYFKGSNDYHTIVKESFVLQANGKPKSTGEYVFRRKKLTNRELKKLFDEGMENPKLEKIKKRQKNLQLWMDEYWKSYVDQQHNNFKRREIKDAEITQRIYSDDKYAYPTFEDNGEDRYSLDYQITSRSFLKNRGVDVHKFLQNLRDNQQLTLANIIQLWSNLAKAVQIVHAAGIYHGDIKYNNILVSLLTGVAGCVDFELSQDVNAINLKALISRINYYSSPQLFCFNGKQLERLYSQEEPLKYEIYNLSLVMLESLLFFKEENERSILKDTLREIRTSLCELKDTSHDDVVVRERHEDAHKKMQTAAKEIFMDIKKLFGSSKKDGFLLCEMEKLLAAMMQFNPQNRCEINEVVLECNKCKDISKASESEFRLGYVLGEIISVLDNETICESLQNENEQQKLKVLYKQYAANMKNHNFRLSTVNENKTFCAFEYLTCLVKKYCSIINNNESLTEDAVADAFNLCGLSGDERKKYINKMNDIVNLGLNNTDISSLTSVAKVFELNNKKNISNSKSSYKKSLFIDDAQFRNQQKKQEFISLQNELQSNSKKLQNKAPRKRNIFGWKTKTPGEFAKKIETEHQKFTRLLKSDANDLALVTVQCDICKEQNERYIRCIKHYDDCRVFNELLNILPKSAKKLRKKVKKMIMQINPDNCEEKLKGIFREIFIYLQNNSATGSQYTELKKVGNKIVATLGLSNSLMFDIYFELFKSMVNEADIKDVENLERYNQWMIKHFSSDKQLLNEYDQRKRDFVRYGKMISFVKNAIKQYQEKTLWQKFTGFFRKKSEIAKRRDQNIQKLLEELKQIERNGSGSLPTLLQSISNAILNSIKADAEIYGDKWENRPSKYRGSLIQVKRCLFAACSVYDMPDLMGQEKKYFNAIVEFAKQQSKCLGECGDVIKIDFYKACSGAILSFGNIGLSQYLAQFERIINSYGNDYFADHAKYYKVDFNSLFESLSASYKHMEESLQSKRQGNSSQNTSNIFTGLNINPSNKVAKVEQIKNPQNSVQQMDNKVPTKKLEQTSNSNIKFGRKF